MNQFDKELDNILLQHGAEQGELHYSLKKALKEAVAVYIIGENEDPEYDNDGAIIARNSLRAEQRYLLRGEK